MHKLIRLRGFLLTLTLLGSAFMSLQADAGPRQDAAVLTATQVLNELRNAPDQNVPNWLLDRAYAVVVVPNVIKVSLIFGGRRGSGLMVVRNDDGSWSNPVFVNLTGGSVGFQWGVQSTDVLLVFASKASIEGIMGGKVTLGADASVAAGPVGRQTEAATDFGLTSQVYSYSRNKGLFLGVALNGSALTINNDYNAEYYGKSGILASEILAPNAPRAPDSIRPFIAALGQTATSAPAPSTPASTHAQAASSSAPASNNQPVGLTTYPMEDKNPGSEPPK